MSLLPRKNRELIFKFSSLLIISLIIVASMGYLIFTIESTIVKVITGIMLLIYLFIAKEAFDEVIYDIKIYRECNKDQEDKKK